MSATAMEGHCPSDLAPGTIRPTDAELLRAYREKKDGRSFGELVDRHRQTVWGVCRRILNQDQDAEDAFQAVFLVLARHCQSIRKGDSVGSWLYGVAYRVSMKARKFLSIRHARQKKWESNRLVPSSVSCTTDSASSAAACREVQMILDEEVLALPAKYQAPFILCCLQGLSKAEAANELGWKAGTVSGRLAMAREILRGRLAQRGVALSAALTAAALAPMAPVAAMEALSVTGVITAVVVPKCGFGGASLSPAALSLAEGAIQAMTLAKIKFFATLCGSLALFLGGAAVGAVQLFGQNASRPAQVSEEAIPFQPPGQPLWAPVDEQILGLALSPGGKTLVTVGARHTQPGQLVIWDLATAKKMTVLRGIPGTRCVAVSPDGRTLACGDVTGVVKLRDAATGALLLEMKGHTVGVNSVAFSPDGKWLVSAGLDKLVKAWDLATKQEFRSYIGHTDMVFSVEFLKNGKSFVSAGRDGTARIWDLDHPREKKVLQGHTAGIEAVTVSPDGKTIATGSWDGTVKLWDTESGKETGTLKEFSLFPVRNSPGIHALAFSPMDGSTLATGSASGVVQLWDIKERKKISLLGKQSGTIWSLAFTPDGKSVISGGADRTARRWEISGPKLVQTYDAGLQPRLTITALANAPDGKWVAIASADGSLRILDSQNGSVIHSLVGHTDMVLCLAITPDGKRLASGSVDRLIKIWDTETGKEVASLAGHPTLVTSLAITPDGKQIASVGERQQIHWWDLHLAKELPPIKGLKSPARAIAIDSSGTKLACARLDGVIELFDIGKKLPPRELNGHIGVVHSLAFGPGGILASGGDDTRVRVWDTTTGTALWTLVDHQQPVKALAFSAGGKLLASGGMDGRLLVWDIKTGKATSQLEGNPNGITALGFAPQGNRLLSGGADAMVLVWSQQTAQASAKPTLLPKTLKGNDQGTWFTRFSPEGGLLAAGGNDGSVKIWRQHLCPEDGPFVGKTGTFWDAACSPDGKLVALGGERILVILDAVSGKVQKSISFQTQVAAVEFSPDSKLLAVGTGNWTKPNEPGMCMLLDVQTGRVIANLEGHKERLFRMRFSSDGSQLVTACRDKILRVWEVPTGKLLKALDPMPHFAKGMVMLPDGRVATAGYDGWIRLWDLQKGREVRAFKAGKAWSSLAATPDGKYLAAGESPWEGKGPAILGMWETATGKEVARFAGHQEKIMGLAITPDGGSIISVGGFSAKNGEIVHYDIRSRKALFRVKTPNHWIDAVAISPNGRTAFTAAASGMVCWSFSFEEKPERTWAAHKEAVLCGTFALGGSVLATGCNDGSIGLWDPETSQSIGVLTGHKGAIRGLAVSPDQSILASASDDQTLKLWDVKNQKLVESIPANQKANSVAFFPNGNLLVCGCGDQKSGKPGELMVWDREAKQVSYLLPNVDSAAYSVAVSPDGAWIAASLGDGSKGSLKIWNPKNREMVKDVPVDNLGPIGFSPDGKWLAAGQGGEKSQGRLLLYEAGDWKPGPEMLGHPGIVSDLAFAPTGMSVATGAQNGWITLWPLAGSPVSPLAMAPGPNPGVSLARSSPPLFEPTQDDGEIATSWSPLRMALVAGAGLVLTMIGLSVLVLLLRRKRNQVRVEGTSTDPQPAQVTSPPRALSNPDGEIAPKIPEMGPLEMQCPGCGKILKAKAEHLGKKGKCPGCSRIVAFPMASP